MILLTRGKIPFAAFVGLLVGLPLRSAHAQSAALVDSIPSGAHFVASAGEGVFYWIHGTCATWQEIDVRDRVWFRSRAAALLEGFEPSRVSGCDAPASWRSEIPPDTPPSSPLETGEVPKEEGCTVARIVDGDTLDCEDGRRVRLLLVDTPEMDQEPFGSMARNALIELAPVGTVLRTESDIQSLDRYGRHLFHLLTLDGASLGETLVRNGMGLVSVFPPNVKHLERFREAAREARLEHRGLWAINGFACPPADHRAGRCRSDDTSLSFYASR